MLLGGRPGQGVVAPLAADAVRPVDQAARQHQAATATGAEDDPEHRACAGARTIDRLRQGEAVGVVGEAHRAPRCASRSRPNGRPLSQVELAFCTRPLAGESTPACRCRCCRARRLPARVRRPCRRSPTSRVVAPGAACDARRARAARPSATPAILVPPRSMPSRAPTPGHVLVDVPTRARESARAGHVSGATDAFAANTSRSDSSARYSSTAPRNSGRSPCANLAGARPVSDRKRRAARAPRQERKPLSGNGFRGFGVRLDAPRACR